MNNETLLKNLTLIIPTFNDDERIKNNIFRENNFC